MPSSGKTVLALTPKKAKAAMTLIPKGHGLRQLLADNPGQFLLYSVEQVQAQAHWRKANRVLKRARRRTQRTGWAHVSDTLQPCDRIIAARLLGLRLPDEKISPQLQRIFDNGNFMHMRWQNYFLSLPPAFEVGINVELRQWPLVGEADMVVRHKEFGLLVIELKSMNGDRWKPLKEALPEHVQQANTYTNVLGADGHVVWYESKDTQDVKTYHHESYPDQFEGSLQRVMAVVDMVLAAKLPAPCGSCDFDDFIGNMKWDDARVTAMQAERERWQSKNS